MTTAACHLFTFIAGNYDRQVRVSTADESIVCTYIHICMVLIVCNVGLLNSVDYQQDVICIDRCDILTMYIHMY